VEYRCGKSNLDEGVLTTDREVHGVNTEYDAFFGIHCDFFVRTKVEKTALKQAPADTLTRE